MTPIQAIIGRDAPEGEPIFDEMEARTVIRRLAAAGYLILPKEPSEAMLKAAGSTDVAAVINGLVGLGLGHAYRAMIAAAVQAGQ